STRAGVLGRICRHCEQRNWAEPSCVSDKGVSTIRFGPSPNTEAFDPEVDRVRGGSSASESWRTSGSRSARASAEPIPKHRSVQLVNQLSPRRGRRLSKWVCAPVVKKTGAGRPRGNFCIPGGLPPQIGQRLPSREI